MASSLRIAAVQMPVSERIDANVAAIGRAIDFAGRERAAILLTPEGSVSGYTPEFDGPATAAAVERIVARAREAHLGLALGTCFAESDGTRHDQLRFYSREGRLLGFHSKILRCASLAASGNSEADRFATAPLRVFEFEGVRVGGLVCNDLWANPLCTPDPDPHLTQQLARMGARIVFHAVNGARSGDAWSHLTWSFHEANLRMRARAGRLWIVTVDNAHPGDLPCSAPGGVVGPEGEWACRTEPSGERCFAFTVPLSE